MARSQRRAFIPVLPAVGLAAVVAGPIAQQLGPGTAVPADLAVHMRPEGSSGPKPPSPSQPPSHASGDKDGRDRGGQDTEGKDGKDKDRDKHKHRHPIHKKKGPKDPPASTTTTADPPGTTTTTADPPPTTTTTTAAPTTTTKIGRAHV